MTIPLRSRATGSAIGLALALSVSGCSVHPLPDDLSPASTVDIVKRIRCEAWEGMTGFRPHEREKVDKIIGATKIGYDVVFSITEQNAAGGGKLEFDRPSFKGKGNGFSLDLSASADASRTNKRSFRFVDKLSELKTEGEKSCRGPATAANLLYPITGATGMGELVRTYIKLEILTDLGSEKSEVFSRRTAIHHKSARRCAADPGAYHGRRRFPAVAYVDRWCCTSRRYPHFGSCARSWPRRSGLADFVGPVGGERKPGRYCEPFPHAAAYTHKQRLSRHPHSV